VSARAVRPPPRPDPQPLANQASLKEQASRSGTHCLEAQQPALGEAFPVALLRSGPPRPVRSSVRIPLPAIIAGFAIWACAGYFSIYGYPGLNAWQSASSPKDLVPATMRDPSPMPVPVVPATKYDPSPMPVPVVPATPAGHPVPPPSSKRATPVHKSAPPPRSPAPIQNAEAAPKARQTPVEAVSVAPAVVTDWKTEMRRELDVCRQEGFFPRVVCVEKVRWKYCAPNRWDTIPECAATAAPGPSPENAAAAGAVMSPSVGMRYNVERSGARATDARQPRSQAHARPPLTQPRPKVAG
jgi:hypothetical protein